MKFDAPRAIHHATRKPFHDLSRRVVEVQELAVRIAQGVDERGRNAG